MLDSEFFRRVQFESSPNLPDGPVGADGGVIVDGAVCENALDLPLVVVFDPLKERALSLLTPYLIRTEQRIIRRDENRILMRASKDPHEACIVRKSSDVHSAVCVLIDGQGSRIARLGPAALLS